LNLLAENLDKAEALSAEIASIIEGSRLNHNSLIKKVETAQLITRTAVAPLVTVNKSAKRKRAKRPIRASQQNHISVRAAAKPKKSRTSTELLSVSPRLLSRYDREELYEKAWKMPMRILAKEYGVSDVALAKTCRKLLVPVPGRGYWAKKAANLPVAVRPRLPEAQAR